MHGREGDLQAIAARLNGQHEGARALPPLILMTDPERLPDPEAAAWRLPRGSGVILRAYRDPQRTALARALAAIARQQGLVLLISNDADLARAVGAAGVHVSEARLRDAPFLRRNHRWLITGAAHSLAALETAARGGVDAALLSPVFATASHPERVPLGVHGFAALTSRARLPVYALGGIDERNAPLLLATKAIGIAAIGALSA